MHVVFLKKLVSFIICAKFSIIHRESSWSSDLGFSKFDRQPNIAIDYPIILASLSEKVTIQTNNCKHCMLILPFIFCLHNSYLIHTNLLLFKTVFKRCAMVRIVHDSNSCQIVSWINLSVSISTAAVASSSIRIWVFLKSALAKHISCLWPTL